MSTGGVIAIVVGAIVVLFVAVNRGLISAGVQVPVGGTGQRGIVAPQPAQNYGGYLAATTAPAVSNLLGTAISGLNNAFSAWLHPRTVSAPPPQLGASAASPSMSAQPSGPASNPLFGTEAYVGPQVPPTLSYNATSGSAFDFLGLSNDNSFDPNASLQAAGVYGA